MPVTEAMTAFDPIQSFRFLESGQSPSIPGADGMPGGSGMRHRLSRHRNDCCDQWLTFVFSLSDGIETRALRPAMRSNPSTVRSFDRRNLSTLTLLNSHVSKTLARTR